MRTLRVALTLVVLTGIGRAVHAQSPAGIAIIVHRSNPIDNLTRAELRQILLLERQSWPNNKKITVVMRDSGQAERTAILRAICGMSDADFDRHVLQTTFRGTAQAPPRTISTVDGMRRFVFNVPGALGYVRSNEVDDTVKVVRIDGKLPSEPGYPISASPPQTFDHAPSSRDQ